MSALKNPKHELFAQGIAAGMTERAAYETAGYKPDDANANKLTRNNQIIARVREFQEMTQARHEETTDSVIAEFNENRLLSIFKEQMAAANAATLGKAKVLGLLVDKFKDVTDLDDMDADQLRAERERNDEEIATLRAAIDGVGESGENSTKH